MFELFHLRSLPANSSQVPMCPSMSQQRQTSKWNNTHQPSARYDDGMFIRQHRSCQLASMNRRKSSSTIFPRKLLDDYIIITTLFIIGLLDNQPFPNLLMLVCRSSFRWLVITRSLNILKAWTSTTRLVAFEVKDRRPASLLGIWRVGERYGFRFDCFESRNAVRRGHTHMTRVCGA